MKKSKFTESQMMAILAEGESGLPVAEVCRKHGISNATYYQWKSKYAGMSANELKRVKDLEAENRRLKRMDALDLIYRLEHANEELDAVSTAFRTELSGKHADVIRQSLSILLERFVQDGNVEGYRKYGPVYVAKFELGCVQITARKMCPK